MATVPSYDPAGRLAHIDAEVTRTYYAGLARGGANDCRCACCKNYVLVRDAFPTELRSAFEPLGIDVTKELEVYECGPVSEDPPLTLYGGWFVVAGRLEKPSSLEEDNEARRDARWIFSATMPGRIVAPSFADQSFIAVDFQVTMPRVLDLTSNEMRSDE